MSFRDSEFYDPALGRFIISFIDRELHQLLLLFNSYDIQLYQMNTVDEKNQELFDEYGEEGLEIILSRNTRLNNQEFTNLVNDVDIILGTGNDRFEGISMQVINGYIEYKLFISLE